MKIVVGLEQNKSDWLEFRKTRIGASDAPIIMGDSPWTTPLQLWSRKLGIEPEQEENGAMRRGKELEPIALRKFNKEYGFDCKPAVVVSSKIDYMSASLDGLYQISDLDDVIVELKCPGKEDHAIAVILGQVPKKYYAQLQHIIYTCDVYFIFYCSYYDDELITIKVDRDDKYIEELIKKEKEFYECLKTFSPPQMTDRDYQQGTKEWTKLAKDLLTVKEIIKEMENQEKEMTASLISMSGNQNTTADGVKFTRSFRKGNVDYSAIQELKDVDLEKYRKESSITWRLSKKD